MFTDTERWIMDETGLIPPDRLRSLAHALRQLAGDAKDASDQRPKDSQDAAALRGRKLGYLEAAHMVEHIIEGQSLHPRRSSSARAKSRAFAVRKAQRRREQQMEDVLADPEAYFAGVRKGAKMVAEALVESRRP